jgi:predicted membrane protein
VASFIISILFFARLFIGFTFGTAIIAIIFAMLGLFSLTMKDVFKQAVFYKEETDWTV